MRTKDEVPDEGEFGVVATAAAFLTLEASRTSWTSRTCCAVEEEDPNWNPVVVVEDEDDVVWLFPAEMRVIDVAADNPPFKIIIADFSFVENFYNFCFLSFVVTNLMHCSFCLFLFWSVMYFCDNVLWQWVWDHFYLKRKFLKHSH